MNLLRSLRSWKRLYGEDGLLLDVLDAITSELEHLCASVSRQRNTHFRETSQFSALHGSNIVQLPKAVAKRATGNCERPFASLLRFAPIDLS